MVKRSKLLQALDAHKGRDYDAEKQKKLAKAAEKRKSTKKTNTGDDENKEEETVETNGKVCWSRELNCSDQIAKSIARVRAG
jgi:rRNA-processing protein EBP2